MTPDQLRAELHYDPETGVFTRAKSGGGVLAGARAGGPDAYGHWTISVFGKRYRAARLAVFYMTGEWPAHDVDHINGKRDDDSWENLRQATRSQNLANMRAKGKSGVKGASWVTAKGRWKAQIRVDGKNRHLGYFDTVEDASNAYRDAAQQHFGEFARWG